MHWWMPMPKPTCPEGSRPRSNASGSGCPGLSQVTRGNVQMAVREGAAIIFVEHIAGSGAVPVFTRVGGRLPTTATGVGLVLLAHAPAEIQDEVLAGPCERYTPHTETDPRALR